MRPEIDNQWISYFQKKGYPQATGIAAEMEGAVYSLIPGELVAKVWSLRGKPELQKLQKFYQKVLESDGTMQTPEILEID